MVPSNPRVSQPPILHDDQSSQGVQAKDNKKIKQSVVNAHIRYLNTERVCWSLTRPSRIAKVSGVSDLACSVKSIEGDFLKIIRVHLSRL